ncbi:MAG TPA: hypothetical protein VD993_03640 [Chitinophagaceae bacterium]|nr:hypothetical protein [Chitinophagaceae bacterium]
MKKPLLFKILGVIVLISGITAAAIYYKPGEEPIYIGKGSKAYAKVKAMDNPEARAQYEFNMVKDPKTNTIPEGVFEAELAQAREIYARQQQMKVDENIYSFQGPNNLGGRVRSIVYDVRYDGTTNQTMFAGGVSGGIYKSTDNGATWTRKSPTNQHYSTTSIAQDPRAGQQDTWYYSTGEAIGNSASDAGAFYLGNGIYKSTDNGETWTRLANSNTSSLEGFNSRTDLVSKVAVNPANGDVYMAALNAIYRSQDGGTNWAIVLTDGGGTYSSSFVTDIVFNSTGTRMYAAFDGRGCFYATNPPGTGCSALNIAGVWTSTTGNSGSWTKIAGDGAATNPVGWDVNNSYGRVVLALAPSNENILYALYWDGDAYPSIEAELYKWDQSTTSWVDRSANLPNEAGGSPGNDPFAVQGGYDLVLAVKPDDENCLFIGGTNIYRSTDAFATAASVTRIGGYAGPSTYASYTNSHADIHSIVFQPGSPTTMVCGNDGGIQRTANNLAATVAWTVISTGFRTYQYYHVTLDPRNGNGKVMGGAQDNGTTRNIGGAGTDFERIFSGDGVSVGLSDNISGTFWEYVGFQSGPIYRRASTLAADFINADIRPSTATDAGLFVTLFELDQDNTQIIYYASDSSLYRNTSASTANTTNWTNLTGIQTTIVDGSSPKTQITALATTRGAYNPATASLFLGTNEGRLYRLDDPANVAAATAPVNITGGTFPVGGNISSIAVNPRNDDTVLVTFSNYGVTSVFWTGNANSGAPTWLNVEGPSLTLPSYRSSVIAVTNNGVEYFVGTSVGLFVATINSATPGATAWTQEGANTIGNAVVTSMALRTLDNRLLVGTHGYGMWATTLTGAGLPVNFTSFTGKAEEKQNRLQWTVENEVDNQGYEVQRKYKHETSFSKIGFVPAKSANASANSYTFPDALVDLGIENVSYRLKQIDIDGDEQYSSIITLTRKVSPRFVEYLSVRGNSLLMRLNGQSNQQITFRLFDSNGRLLKQQRLADRTQEVSLAGLPRATFVVEITHPDGRRHSQKIVY